MAEPQIIPLTANTLGRLDTGRFGVAIDRALRLIEQDIADRHANAAGKCERRKLKIEITLEPIVEYDQQTREVQLVGIHVEPRVYGSVPPTVGSVHQMRIRNGSAHFNLDAPHSFDARPLFDMNDDDPAERAADESPDETIDND